MIPAAILFGLLTGGLASAALRRAQILPATCGAVTAALAWGVLAGVGDSSFVTFAAGTVIAAANIAVGAIVGAALGLGLRPRFREHHGGLPADQSSRAG